ncbi:unnamed protein product [Dovyalis caffra]|uniref:Uncharacterized protein n=1 Tax=Dovyalis caffra TaxID=77055 RepID=A0AAV1SUP0_9ROSI|nr:unnamed protein product [Dovyalis caffra]
MSSVFCSESAICADYFGDKYGVPLPSSMIQKITRIGKAKELEDSKKIGQSASKNKNGDNKEQHGPPPPPKHLEMNHLKRNYLHFQSLSSYVIDFHHEKEKAKEYNNAEEMYTSVRNDVVTPSTSTSTTTSLATTTFSKQTLLVAHFSLLTFNKLVLYRRCIVLEYLQFLPILFLNSKQNFRWSLHPLQLQHLLYQRIRAICEAGEATMDVVGSVVELGST